MTEQEIARFLVTNVEPVQDDPYGSYYRGAAYLKDGTYLPCVMFGNPRRRLDLARQRLLTESQSPQFDLVLRAFVISEAIVPIVDVSRVEPSPFAWSLDLIDRIEGETTMGWTAFTVRMRDGRLFQYGSSYEFFFLDLPAGYTAGDVDQIHSGTLLNERGELEGYDVDKDTRDYLRERSYFYCYSDWLPTSHAPN